MLLYVILVLTNLKYLCFVTSIISFIVVAIMIIISDNSDRCNTAIKGYVKFFVITLFIGSVLYIFVPNEKEYTAITNYAEICHN